jgi:hypothetical protein
MSHINLMQWFIDDRNEDELIRDFQLEERVYHTRRQEFGTFVRYEVHEQALVEFDNGAHHFVSLEFLKRAVQTD